MAHRTNILLRFHGNSMPLRKKAWVKKIGPAPKHSEWMQDDGARMMETGRLRNRI